MSGKEKISVIIPVRDNSKGTPVTLIDWDRELERAGFDYEIVLSAREGNAALSAIKANFRHASQNFKFAFSDTDKLSALIKSGVSIASGEVVVLASAELFPSGADLPKLIEPIVSGESDIAFGSPGELLRSVTETVCRLFSPVGSREFEFCAIAAKKDALARFMPVIEQFPEAISEALSIAAEKGGFRHSEFALAAALTPGLSEKSPSSRIFRTIKTRIAFELAWSRTDLADIKRTH